MCTGVRELGCEVLFLMAKMSEWMAVESLWRDEGVWTQYACVRSSRR